ncbi:MAG: FtsB family cell division protein [Pseudobdellovibrionaceae bacterium]
MKFKQWPMQFRKLLDNPKQVAFLGLFFFFCSVVAGGNMVKLWSLHQDRERLQLDLLDKNLQKQKIVKQIQQVKDPAFIERQARDTLDMADEHDLVFVFAED